MLIWLFVSVSLDDRMSTATTEPNIYTEVLSRRYFRIRWAQSYYS